VVRLTRAVHPAEPRAEGVVAGDGPLPHEGRRHRRHQELRQLQQLRRGVGGDDAAPRHDHGPLGLGEERRRPVQLPGVGLHLDAVAAEADLLGELDLLDGDLGVLRQVHQDGAPAAGGGDVEGGLDRPRNLGRPPHLDVVLGDGGRDADDVHLLERVGADHAGGDLAREGDHRRGVDVGGGYPRDEVRRPGPRRRQADADAPAGPGVAVGHVRGPLLVAGKHKPQVGAVQRVADGQDGAAGDSEEEVDALPLQRPHEGLGARHLNHAGPPPRRPPAPGARSGLGGVLHRSLRWASQASLRWFSLGVFYRRIKRYPIHALPLAGGRTKRYPIWSLLQTGLWIPTTA